MPVASFTRKSKVATIIPIALLSGVWSVSLVSYGAAQASGNGHPSNLPDGTKVPAAAIQAPANLPQPGSAAPAVPSGQADAVVASASTSGIPAIALSAYENASRIINSADKACNIPWELIAAIGRVESDHGRYDGNHLNGQGVAVPGIYGPVLDGRSGTQAVPDTDNGLLDGNKQWDRAVGPMQFLPSTWQVVKVDATNDGQRNPQDINDAALAAAVYLCSGNENLGARTGQESAVYRYNHSHDYVNLVLRIMEAYEAGDYSSVPSGSYGGTLFSPSITSGIRDHVKNNGASSSGIARNGGNAPASTTPSGKATQPSAPGGANGSNGGGTTPGGTSSQGSNPVSGLADGVKGAISAGPSAVAQPVTQLLDAAEALTVCNKAFAAVSDPLGLLKGLNQTCADKITGKTEAQAEALIPDTLSALVHWLTGA
jgi:hypothetical protein